jgi:hypothetical protein
VLKFLACLFMLIDHIGFYYYDFMPEWAYTVFRAVGRLAFPIFAWYIARGYSRTRNILFYFLRLAAFAVVSELIIRFAHSLLGFSLPGTNVLVTFALSIVLLAGYQIARYSWLDVVAGMKPVPAASGTLPVKRMPSNFNVRINLGGIELDPRIGLPLGSLMMFISFLATIWLNPDYEIYGLLTVFLIYLAINRHDETDWEKRIWLFLLPLNLAFMAYRIQTGQAQPAWAVMQLFSMMSIPLFMLSLKEKKPPLPLRYAFYLFYPLHILLLCWLKITLF